MVDCEEGTIRQFEQQPYKPKYNRVRVGQISKIFITHMHGESLVVIRLILRALYPVVLLPGPPFRAFRRYLSHPLTRLPSHIPRACENAHIPTPTPAFTSCGHPPHIFYSMSGCIYVRDIVIQRRFPFSSDFRVVLMFS